MQIFIILGIVVALVSFSAYIDQKERQCLFESLGNDLETIKQHMEKEFVSEIKELKEENERLKTVNDQLMETFKKVTGEGYKANH